MSNNKRDATFQIVRDLILTKSAGLRCIGVDISDNYSVKIKYYLCEIPGGDDMSELLLKLKNIHSTFVMLMRYVQSYIT